MKQGIAFANILDLRRARALTVDEVVLFHRICDDEETGLRKQVIACHALLMLYGRCKVSDVAMIKEIKQYSRQGDPASSMTCLIRGDRGDSVL